MLQKRFIKKLAIWTVASALIFSSLSARTLYDRNDQKKFDGNARSEEPPAHGVVLHNVGNIALAVSNNGTFGTYYTASGNIDYFTGKAIRGSCEVPKGSGIDYLYGAAFWIGAIVGRDTLVSVGEEGWTPRTQEFSPNTKPTGELVKRSIIDPTDFELYEDAISEEDYIAQYTDTVVRAGETPTPDIGGIAFKPIGIEIIQKSYAWSYEYAEDFVLFDYTIENIGQRTLRGVYMGIYVDADVGAISGDDATIADDDLCGFIPEFLDTILTCEFIDLANIAWIADADGDMSGGTLPPARHVTGTRIVRTPVESLEVSFNWWKGDSPELDFGPREQPLKGRLKEPFRDFGHGGLGTPSGDRNKYYQLRNQEFDYDQAYTCKITENDTLWQRPNPANACDFANGGDTRYLLSFGPFNIDPGEVLPLSFAYVAGQNLHVDPDNARLNLPDDPGAYYDGLVFKDLQVNARWAEWIYDNPGVDTDSDGYAGVMRFCPIDSALSGIVDTIVDSTTDPPDTTFLPRWLYTVVDTSFAVGDGVPDFRGASPPPAPALFIEPKVGEIRVRFNGYRSETTRDPFSRIVDFEGYSIYVGRDDRSSSYAKVISYDRENFNKWTYNASAVPPVFQLKNEPYTYSELYNLYACDSLNNCDLNFDPLRYTINRPFHHLDYFVDSIFYFERQGFNASSLTDPGGIRKVYPSILQPTTLVLDSLHDTLKTPDGLPKYYEYEFTVTRLLPTVPYWISVTAFDFGSPSSGLPSLETNVTQNTANAYPMETYEAVDSLDLKVFVYPNPYRIDADYRAHGYEGVDPTGHRLTQTERPDDRTREIHFANVPANCIISIFSLDGDLVREIIHDVNPTDPNASHESWDMITRNTQSAVSGLYYWTVENTLKSSPKFGEVQMGKLVIIM